MIKDFKESYNELLKTIPQKISRLRDVLNEKKYSYNGNLFKGTNLLRYFNKDKFFIGIENNEILLIMFDENNEQIYYLLDDLFFDDFEKYIKDIKNIIQNENKNLELRIKS
jgi:hypothetical protein|nr:MAG TPA: hypothetical protein [Caudoviricetes sp.]